jgi:hypothetical protein
MMIRKVICFVLITCIVNLLLAQRSEQIFQRADYLKGELEVISSPQQRALISIFIPVPNEV